MTHLARTIIVRALNGEVFQLKPDPRVSSNIRNDHPVDTTLGYDIPPGWIIDPYKRDAWEKTNIPTPSRRKPLKSPNFRKKTRLEIPPQMAPMKVIIDTSHLSPEDHVNTLPNLSPTSRDFFANYLRSSPRRGKGTKKKGTKRR